MTSKLKRKKKPPQKLWTPEEKQAWAAFIRRHSEWGTIRPAPSTSTGIKPEFQFLPGGDYDYTAGLEGTPADHARWASNYLKAKYGPGSSNTLDTFRYPEKRHPRVDAPGGDVGGTGQPDGLVDATAEGTAETES